MQTVTPFNLAALVRSMVSGTYGKIESNESRRIADEIERYGHPNNGMIPLPVDTLNRQTRATPLAAANTGGYLDQTNLQGYIGALQAQTNVLQLGATVVPLDKNTTVTPAGLVALAPTWQHDEMTPTVAALMTYGQKTFARKNLLVSVPISIQLLKQSNAQELIIGEATRAIGAETDKQAIQGLGLLGTPLGLATNPQINSSSGASLAYTTLVTMMTGVAGANAIVNADAVGWLTTPIIAGLLKLRYFSTAQFPIWSGALARGNIDLMTAMSSTNVPSGALMHGDFSRLLIGQWTDGLQIDIDRYTNFQQAYVTVRFCVAVDFVVANTTSFQILTGVT